MLIADDNRDWADGLAALLHDVGYSVRTTYDGAEALAIAAGFQPHIVMLDIRMPRMSGYEVARILAEDPGKPRPLLIAITAWTGDHGRQHALATGFDHYFAKSADPAGLLELLKRI